MIQSQIFQTIHWTRIAIKCHLSEMLLHFSFAIAVAESETEAKDCVCLWLIRQISIEHAWEMRLSDSVLLKVSQQCIFRLIHKEMNTGAAYFFLTPIRDSTLRLSGMAERDSCCFLWDWEMTLVTNSLWVAALRAVWAILKRCKN